MQLLVDKKINLKDKRKLLKQKGGFLLPVIASIISSVVGKFT